MLLRQHQQDGAAWLAARQHGYLGDPPGGQKTRTLLHAAALCGAARPLVFCPAIVQSHWRHEGALLGLSPRVTSYDKVVRGGVDLMRELLAETDPVLLLDEAHYLKHAGSKRTQVVLGPHGYARRMQHTFPASGTPIPRNPMEYWPVLASLFPQVALDHGCRTRAEFEAKFCTTRRFWVRGALREKIVGLKASGAEAFKQILAATMLRREQFDGPALWWQPLMLDAADYAGDTVFDTALRGAMPWEQFLATLSDTPHLARYRQNVGLAKVKPVVELVAHELQASDDKVVLFAYHRAVLHALRDAFASFGVAYIDGETSTTQREAAKTRFIEGPARVFIGQNSACGTGMDGLQHAAHRILLVEPSWVATENDQYGKRLARPGQTHPHVVAQMVSLAGTLDDWIIRQNVREAADLATLFPVEGL